MPFFSAVDGGTSRLLQREADDGVLNEPSAAEISTFASLVRPLTPGVKAVMNKLVAGRDGNGHSLRTSFLSVVDRGVNFESL